MIYGGLQWVKFRIIYLITNKMDKVVINPKDYVDVYINNLNQSFKNWGGQKEYDWIFHRIVGAKKSDIIVIYNENNDVIAGSGITYRKLKLDDQIEFDIGIMTGSWTLPEARGKGCFSKMIEISKDLCRQNGVPFLTAFVMESNPSYRRLKDAGSFLIPTNHFFSKEVIHINKKEIITVKGETKLYSEIYNKCKKTQKGTLNFNYTFEEFLEQYINRIKKIEILKINDDFTIIEETESVIKVHIITYDSFALFEYNIKALSNWGLEKKAKKLLLFSTKREIAERLNLIEFENLPGFFTVLSTFDNPVIALDIFNQIDINMGDKM